jgi:glycosyltransferase involved in cell wall biosynthesis
MRILLYTHDWMPLVGGIQTITMFLAKGLAEWPQTHPNEAIEVTLVTQTPGGAMDDSILPFRVVRQPSIGNLIRLVRAADIVHVAGPALLPLALGLVLRRFVVAELHGLQVACPNGLLFYEPTQGPCPGHFMARRFHKCLECNRVTHGIGRSLQMLLLTPLRRWLSNRADTNITPTDWLAAVSKLKRMRTIYHGISPRPGTTTDKPLISTFAFQGRLVTAKGVAVLLRAAECLLTEGYDFRLKIIGDGPEMARLKSLATGLSGRIEFLGHVPDDRLGEVQGEVATIVMPSLGGEVFGLVAAENMLRGKLLIVSDIGSLGEVVGDTGLVFCAGDATALASCMRQVLEKPSLVASLGSAARARAMQVFDLDRMIQAHVSAYREALRR